MRFRTQGSGPARAVSALGLAALAVAWAPGPQAYSSSFPRAQPLGSIIARAPDSLGNVAQVVQIAGGRVLALDTVHHRLVVFDSMLLKAHVVADSARGAPHGYGADGGAILGFRGDSVWFADVATSAMVLISPKGNVLRATTIPSPLDARALAAGRVAVDAQGRVLFYHATPACRSDATTAEYPLVRVKPSPRTVDTVGSVFESCQRAAVLAVPRPLSPAGPRMYSDEWVALSTGTIALIRGADHRIDWIDGAGGRRSTPPFASPADTLSDDARLAIRAELRKVYSQSSQMVSQQGAEPLPLHARADRDGHIWVPEDPVPPVPFAPVSPRHPRVYDIIDGAGKLVERVELPTGASIVGFGARNVYLVRREGSVVALERARIH